LTLPNTPPKGASNTGEKSDALGLGALQMFKDPSFAVFAICVFIASIPACNYFFAFQVTYLTQRGYPSPLALTTLNQFSEIFFMAMLPVFVTRIGLKWVITIGMVAWAARYLCFMCPHFEIAVVGLLLHGLCYSFMYVAAYMYAERKAPADIKASAQSLMVFLLLGIGQVGGSQLYGNLKDLPNNTPTVEQMNVASTISSVPEKELAGLEETYILPESTDAKTFWASLTRNNPQQLPEWVDANMVNSAWRYLNLSATLESVINKAKGIPEKEHVKTWSELIDVNGDNVITSAELEAAQDTIKIGDVEFAKSDFEKVFKMIVKHNTDDGDFSITRQQYLDAQSSNWHNLFLIPALWIAIFAVIFALFGKEPGKENTHNQKGPATRTHD
jgi:hypothetical protein